jgi:hypothetical protein
MATSWATIGGSVVKAASRLLREAKWKSEKEALKLSMSASVGFCELLLQDD